MMNNKSTGIFSAPLDFFKKQKIYEGIKECDYLMADEKCVKRLVGIKCGSSFRKGLYVTIVCTRCQMAYAKQVAYALGKMIVPSPNNSVRMLKVLTEH